MLKPNSMQPMVETVKDVADDFMAFLRQSADDHGFVGKAPHKLYKWAFEGPYSSVSYCMASYS